jgi:broad specificity phosphatase PhoE
MRRTRTLLCALAVIAVAHVAAAADPIVFVVRHAERSDAPTQATMMGNDPPLSKAGEARAERLASMLRSAGIKHIFTTEFRRTRQTAAPLAAAIHVAPVMAPAKDVPALVAAVRKQTEPTLVVGHGNTVPDILEALGVTEPVTLGDTDYGSLFIVVRHASGPPTLIRLHY